MVAYTSSGTITVPNIELKSEYEAILGVGISRENTITVDLIETYSTVHFESGELPPLTITKIDDFNFKLEFNQLMHKAKFILNDIEINEMTINDRVCNYYLNPSMLHVGENVLRILITDNDDTEHLKLYKINKNLTDNQIKINDFIYIKGKKYQVLSNQDNVLTLNSPLASDIKQSNFAESPTFKTIPYASLTFYNESPTMLPMNFVKAIFVDGQVEEMYEINNGIGDILHTKLDVVRDNTDIPIKISGIQYALMPDEV